MCTLNITIDDLLFEQARHSFHDEEAMKEWMKEQMSIILQKFVVTQSNKTVRHAHKHDALMGVLSDSPELDYKALHLSEKYKI